LGQFSGRKFLHTHTAPQNRSKLNRGDLRYGNDQIVPVGPDKTHQRVRAL
jgi:hypothetical protein